VGTVPSAFLPVRGARARGTVPGAFLRWGFTLGARTSDFKLLASDFCFFSGVLV
jgi:hypothetical protein